MNIVRETYNIVRRATIMDIYNTIIERWRYDMYIVRKLRAVTVIALLCAGTRAFDVSVAQACSAHDIPFLRGINLASGAFGPNSNPRRYGYNYIYASPSSVDYYQSKGFNLFRIAFLWESMQPALSGPLSQAELGYLDALVEYITGKGLYVALDIHNFSTYNGLKVGAGLPVDVFADLWARLAVHYRDNPFVIFDLMNEPNNMLAQTVLDMNQAAIDAIRATGAKNVALVEGNAWSGASNWLSSSSMLAGLVDPLDNIVFSPHQYLDQYSSGTQPYCQSSTIGVERIQAVTQWAREHKVRLLLGEFGAGANVTCEAAVTSMLGYMQQNADVWTGWAWWAGGPWWGSYFMSIEPQSGVDRPQMRWLTPFLSD